MWTPFNYFFNYTKPTDAFSGWGEGLLLFTPEKAIRLMGSLTIVNRMLAGFPTFLLAALSYTRSMDCLQMC